MILIVVTLALISVLYGYLKEQNIYNPIVLFSGFFGFISLLASFQLYGMNKTSDKAYLIIVLGVLGFICGAVFYKCVFSRFKISNLKSSGIGHHDTINTKLLFIAVLCMTIYITIRFTSILPLLLKGVPFDYIRMIYFGAEFDGVSINHTTAVLEMFLNLPILYAVIPIIAVDLVSGKEREIGKGILILAVIWISLSTIVSGGRVLFYIVGVVLFFAALIVKKKLRISRRVKISILLILIGAIAFMYFMSIKRNKSGEYDFLYSVYVYFSGALPHMSYRLETIDFSNKFTYGMTFVSGLLRPPMIIYKWLFGSFPAVYQQTIDIGVELQSAVDIGTGQTYNAFATSFFYFFYDLGYIGVIVDSILYGIICEYFYIKMKRKMTKMNIALYLLIIQGILTSMIRYPFVLFYYTYAFAYLLLFYSKNKFRFKKSKGR